MTGKEKCRMLKEIRAQIAAQNDISFVTEECTHKGQCKGTCPKCESEVRYLEEQLDKRRSARKKVALAGVSAGLVLSLTGCSATDTIVETLDVLRERLHPAVIDELDGDIQITGMESIIEPLEGEVPDEPDLMGIAVPAEDQ